MSACNNKTLSFKRKKNQKNDKKSTHEKLKNGKIAGCFCVIVAFFQTPWLEQ